MSATGQQVRTLLAYLGTTMIATGQPVGELEDELAEVSPPGLCRCADRRVPDGDHSQSGQR